MPPKSKESPKLTENENFEKRWANKKRIQDLERMKDEKPSDWDTNEAYKLRGEKWCDLHGKNKTHDTAACVDTQNEKALRAHNPPPHPQNLKNKVTKASKAAANRRRTDANAKKMFEIHRWISKQ